MAQNALTVTASNPTPPTNWIFVGNTPPLDPAQAFADDGIPKALPNSVLGGTNLSTINEDASLTAWPVGGGLFTTSTTAANTANAPGAGISVTHEGRGTELSSTMTSPTPTGLGQLKMVSCGPVMNTQALRDAGPNAGHASSLSPATALTPTLTGASGASNVAGPGTTLLTATGTNYNRTSVVNISGVPQTTNYVSATSLTVTNAMKKQTAGAGTLPVTVTNGNSGLTTAPQNWTFT